MITDEMIKRINELSKKKKTVGLTDAEIEEQSDLRRKYIDAFKANLKSQLDMIKIVDEAENKVSQEIEKLETISETLKDEERKEREEVEELEKLAEIIEEDKLS